MIYKHCIYTIRATRCLRNLKRISLEGYHIFGRVLKLNSSPHVTSNQKYLDQLVIYNHHLYILFRNCILCNRFIDY